MRQAGALVLIIVLAVPLIMTALAVLSVSPWVLDRDFYLDLLSGARIYEALLDEAIPEEGIPEHALEQSALLLRGAPELEELSAASRAALARALQEAVTPEYLRDQAVRMTNQLFDSLDGAERRFAPYIDLAPLKRNLRGEAGARFARNFVLDLPECAAGEDPFGGGAGLPRCRPAGMSIDEAESIVRESLPDLAERLPDRYPVAPYPETGGAGAEPGFLVPPMGTARLVLLGVLVAVVALGALLGAAFLAGESRRETVLWMGWPLLVPAVVIFAGGLALLAAAHLGRPLFMSDPLLGPVLARMPQTAEAVYALVRSVLRRVAGGFLTWGGFTVGAAVGLIVWGHLIPREERLS